VEGEQTVNGRFNSGDVVLGNWTLTKPIGEGSYGRVFEAEREDFGTTYKAAIKIITIPQSQSEIISARAEGMSDESVTAYFRSFVEEIVREFALMSRLKGTANVVSYEDHTVLQHEDGVGWDIIIRMELLTPLLHHSIEQHFTRQDVIKLGIDICRALELCQKFNIIHRDIKPENIFISDLNDYKLGDFGIARTVEKTTSGLSKKGTYTYMAPEVYREGAYGSSVDIYSLGIVLYRLLNENRAPFLPEYPAPITHGDREAALAKRISGAKLPLPKNVGGRFAEIVMKACAYDSKDRYSSPMQMRQELEAILYNREEAPIIYPQGDEAPIKSVEYVDDSAPRSEPSVHEPTESLFGETASSEKTESLFGGIASSEKTEIVFDKTSNETENMWKNSKEIVKSEAPEKNPEKNKKILSPAIVLLILSSVIMLIIAVIFFFLINNFEKERIDSIDNHLRVAAQRAADYLTVEELDLFHTAEDMQRPEWEKIRTRLQRFAEENSVLYVYYWRYDGENYIQYIIDNDEDEEYMVTPDLFYAIENDTFAAEVFVRITAGESWVTDLGSYTDSWDGLLFAAVPVFNHDGTVYGAAGVDISDEVLISMRNNINIMGFVVIFSLLTSIALGFFGIRLYRRKTKRSFLLYE